MKNFCVLVAGGTGGHINAAIGLGEKLSEMDFDVLYLSGQRPLDYKLFKSKNVIHLQSQPLRSKSPVYLLKAVLKNILTFIQIFVSFVKKRPRFIVGAGGYVCGPTLMAGWILRCPIYIIEQNAVMGLTNKILSNFADKIFLHFKETKGFSAGLQKKAIVVGNPIRKSIQYCPPRNTSDGLHVLVFGGSLGATQINMMIFDLIQKDYSFPISFIHQTGTERQPSFVLGKNVEYKAFQYLDEIQSQYSWCDVIIARAGASTVSELRVVGKPCYLVPYPQATDDHQFYNAKVLKGENLFDVEFNPSNEKDSVILDKIEDFIKRYSNKALLTPSRSTKVLDTSIEMIKAIKSDVGLT